jgi:HPt (histidine-containing phosphotransfer) domain-containing protein
MIERRDEFEALLAAARADFAARLEAKLREIQQLSSEGAWAGARRAAHRLRGSAATYGFGAVSEAAAAMEDILIASNEAPGEEAKNRFDSALRAALLASDRAASEGP